MKYLCIIIVATILFSCGESDFYRNVNKNPDIKIYLVKENQLELHSPVIDIYALELENTPWVKGSDILFYDWSAHSFYLNKEIGKSENSGKHFVVVSGEQRLFTGVFWPMFMSSFPMIPSITPENEIFTPKDVIRFGQFGFFEPGELDKNLEFKKYLLENGILKHGIKVELIRLEKQNATTLKYTFSVSNLDEENIYVPDPEKMGAERFHFYTNAISLNKADSYYWPSEFETKESEYVQSKWLVKLKPGTKITRTVSIDGFSSLPNGKVNATFRFPGAHLKESGAWQKPDGRVWLGDFIAKVELNIH